MLIDKDEILYALKQYFKLFCGRIKTLALESANIIKKHATLAIESELNSLKALLDYVDDDFANIVQHILNSTGRVVITGIGKSAIIAQKIVATLNSTGQPAIFMHAADAVHGDLGIIQKDDLIIAISKSGNTPEIKLLAPLLRNFGNKLVAMVGDTTSELAKLADFVINTTIDKEACPNNLAPTTSTTAQMLMGDALAVALLQMRNFSGNDFSKFHPGGALGKRLYLRCGDIAAKNEKPIISPNANIKEAILEITRKRLGVVVVAENDSTIAGVITDGDIRRMLEKYDTFAGIFAREIMNPNPATIDADSLASEAAAMMTDKKISQLIVLKNKQYLGIIHIHDLNREGIL